MRRRNKDDWPQTGTGDIALMEKVMKWTVSIPVLTLLLAMNVSASDREKATCVGGGRYVGEGGSIGDAQWRQRSDDSSDASKTVHATRNATNASSV